MSNCRTTMASDERSYFLALARRICIARRCARRSLADVGLRLGVARQTVNDWEKGRSRLSAYQLVRLAFALDADERWLLTGAKDGPISAALEEFLRPAASEDGD